MRATDSIQDAALASRHRTTHIWFEVADADGSFVDLTDAGGIDWLDEIQINVNEDDPISQATIALHREVEGISIAPFIEASPLNEDSTSAYAPLINAGREVRVYVATVAAGTSKATAEADRVLLWRGTIDDPQWGGSRSTLRFTARDPGALLNDTIIEVTRTYGDNDSPVAVQTVMQSILDDNATELGESITLNVIGDPDFGIREYELGNVSVLEALLELASLNGWSLRYMWSESDADFLLTFYEPDRDKASPDLILGPDDYYSVQNIGFSRSGIRNVGEVLYTDTSGVEQTVSEVRSDSVSEYGRRFIRLDERQSSIRTSTQANKYLDAVLDDTQFPTADQTIENAFWWPVELGDLIRWEANGVHYDTDQDYAVYGYTHVLNAGTVRTLIQTSGQPSGGFYRWLARESLDVDDEVVVGTAIQWLGEAASHPADPDTNDAYRNTTDGIVYLWDGSSWEIMVRDGAPGTGTGLELRYSGPTAGENISTTFNPALHLWAQFRRADQSWPSDWARIVGEDGAAGADGVYFDYRFRVAASQPATPTGTNPASWSDSPPAHDPDAGDILWMTRALKSAADDSLLGTWSTPVQMTGPQGPTGPQGDPAEIEDESITTAKLASLAVTEAKLAALAVTAAKVADSAITTAKIANDAVTAGKLADNAVGTEHIQALAITAAEVADSAISTAKLANNAVTAGKLAADAVGETHLQDLAVTADKVAASAITTAKIADAAIEAGKIASGAVTEAKIGSGAVTTLKLANAAVDAAKIAASAVTETKIADDAVTSPKIVAGAITTAKIDAGAVNAEKIAAGAITTSKLAVGGAGAALNDDPTMSDLSAWSRSGAWSIDSVTSGPAGPTAMRITETTSTSSRSIFSAKTYPIDENRTYRVSVWAVQTAGDGRNYLCVDFFDADGDTITGSGGGATGWTSAGTYHYWDVSNAVFPSSWTRYEFTFGPDGEASIPAGAKSLRVGALVVRAGTGTSTVYLQDYRLEEVIPGVLIQNGAITAAKIAAGEVQAGHIAAGAVTTAKLDALAVTTDKLAANAVTAAKIAAGTITATQIASDTITASQIAANAITASEIATGAVTAAKIDSLAVTTDKLAANAVTAAKIAAGTITATQIASNTITAANIAANAVTASEIATGAVTTAKLDALAVTADKVAANAITASKILVNDLASINADLGSVTAGILHNASGTPTAGIRLNAAYSKPASWVRYLDFAATSTAPFLQHPALSLLANGSATFSGTVSASSFTASTAFFNGSIEVHTGGYPQIAYLRLDSNEVGYWDRIANPDVRLSAIEFGNGSIDMEGDVEVDGTLTAAGIFDSTVASHRRYKDDVRDFAYNPDALMALRPREWVYSAEAPKSRVGKYGAGFVADEVPSIFAEENGEGYKGERIVAQLVGGWQDHERRIAALERLLNG